MIEYCIGFSINPTITGKVFVKLAIVTGNIIAIGLIRYRSAARLASQYPTIRAA
jgi:hypothetical protein